MIGSINFATNMRKTSTISDTDLTAGKLMNAVQCGFIRVLEGRPRRLKPWNTAPDQYAL